MTIPRFSPPLHDRWGHLPEQDQHDLQDVALRRLVREQLIHSPFYRRRLGEAGIDLRRFSGWDDFERIPFTTKKDIVPSPENPGAPRELVLQPTPETLGQLPLGGRARLALGALLEGRAGVKKRLGYEYRPVSMTFTTGRSSEPTPFFYSLYDMQVQQINGARLLEVLDCDVESERGINLFPYAPHLAFWQTAMASLGSGLMMLHTGGGRIMGSDKILNICDKMKPAILIGIPGYTYHLLRKAEADGFKFPFVRRVALGGEKVSPLMRQRILEILGRMGAQNPVVSSILGFTESRQTWGECPHTGSSGFHMYPDMSVIELIDPDTGKPVPDGHDGELVYTGLVGRASMLVRYRTGDFVVGGVTRGACPHCGRTVPRLATEIQRFSNKKDFHLTKVKGTLVDFNIMTSVFAGCEGVEEWQVVLHKADDDPLGLDLITAYIALSPGFAEPEVVKRLRRELQHQCEITPNTVVVESLEALLDRVGMEDKMKEERIVDDR